MWDTCTSHFGPKKFDRVGRRGQGRSKYGTFGSFQWEMCKNALFWPSLTPPANPVKFFWSKMACTGVPHIVLHVSCRTRTSGGYFWPSEVRFRGILALSSNWFIMQNTKKFYLFRPYGPDFKINIFWILTSNPVNGLKQNPCLFLTSKKYLQDPCGWDNTYMKIKTRVTGVDSIYTEPHRE